MLTVSAAPRMTSAHTDSHIELRQREHHRRNAEDDHRLEHAHADAARERDGARAPRVISSAPTAGAARSTPSPAGPGVQDVAGIDRQQRRGAAEQHGEQVERDRAEDRRIVADEADAGEQLERRSAAPSA